jgi:hypothetical protein
MPDICGQGGLGKQHAHLANVSVHHRRGRQHSEHRLFEKSTHVQHVSESSDIHAVVVSSPFEPMLPGMGCVSNRCHRSRCMAPANGMLRARTRRLRSIPFTWCPQVVVCAAQCVVTAFKCMDNPDAQWRRCAGRSPAQQPMRHTSVGIVASRARCTTNDNNIHEGGPIVHFRSLCLVLICQAVSCVAVPGYAVYCQALQPSLRRIVRHE